MINLPRPALARPHAALAHVRALFFALRGGVALPRALSLRVHAGRPLLLCR
jgi:hypothetical protein